MKLVLQVMSCRLAGKVKTLEPQEQTKQCNYIKVCASITLVYQHRNDGQVLLATLAVLQHYY